MSGRIWLPGATRPGEPAELFIPGRPPRQADPAMAAAMAEIKTRKEPSQAPATSGEDLVFPNPLYDGIDPVELEREQPGASKARIPREERDKKLAAQAVAQEHVQAIKEGRPPRRIGEILGAIAPVAAIGSVLTAPVAAAVSTVANWGDGQENILPTVLQETGIASTIGGVAVPTAAAIAAMVAARRNRR